jgi:hypothetical protein
MGDMKPNKVMDPEARAALVWILGQFGKHLESKSGGTVHALHKEPHTQA